VPETYRLDVTGTFCPLPVLLSVREMQNLVPGDVLELLGDDPAMLEDVPEWCAKAGHRLVQYTVEDDGSLRFLIEKGERPPERRRQAGARAEP
jgi:tRNA 2-thiouridine synthesizing protein A